MSTFADRWRFAVQRRWFTYLAMAVVFAIACIFLSRWQFGRNAQVSSEHTLVYGNYAAAAVAPSTLLPTRSYYSKSISYRTVTLTGDYLSSKQLLVRDRTYGPNPGFEVLVPLKETNGDIFIVDRGWVPIGTRQTDPDYVPPPPTGRVTVTAHLQGSESILPGRVAPAGQISEINVPTVVSMTDLSAARVYTGAYGLLKAESPAPASRPARAKKPVLDNGPFLSYAFQWILFALMGFAGLAWALRSEYRIRNSDDPIERARAAERHRKARLRAPTDADLEDFDISSAAEAANRAATDRATREIVDSAARRG